MADQVEKTDEQIAQEVQAGNAQAFGLLVERYEAKLARYAKKFLLENEDAKDLLQDVFIKAYVNIRGFDAGRKFSPWIYRIAHNEFINAVKKKSWTNTISIFDFDVLFPHPVAKETADEKTNRQELKNMLDQSLAQLDPKYRDPLVLYYFEEMDYEEIADILEIPTSTVGVRLRRGRVALKKIMESQNKN